MPELEWHEMADEQPTDEDAHYLLLENGGGMCLGIISRIYSNGMMTFCTPNRWQHPWSDGEDFKAWAKIPKYEMTPKQAAEYLGISASRVRAMLRTKTLNGFKEPNGNEWRIRAAEIDRYKRGEDA